MPVVRGEIDMFNSMIKHFDLGDTIKYQCNGTQLNLDYKGEILTDWSYDENMCGKKFMLRGGGLLRHFSILVSIPFEENLIHSGGSI